MINQGDTENLDAKLPESLHDSPGTVHQGR
jgi:hypothetical protein